MNATLENIFSAVVAGAFLLLILPIALVVFMVFMICVICGSVFSK